MIKSWKQGRLFFLPLTTLHCQQDMALARHYLSGIGVCKAHFDFVRAQFKGSMLPDDLARAAA
jgi:hypothetical protein